MKIIVKSLFDGYTMKFADFKRNDIKLQIVFTPLTVDLEKVPEIYLRELNLLKAQTCVVSSYNSLGNINEFWGKIKTKFPILADLVLRMLVCFPNTYFCEAGFNHVKYIKNSIRSKI